MKPHPITIRSAAAWVGVAIAAFAVTLVLVLGDRANLLDETWMLWVTKRVTSGDRLYSDVYYVSTPLGIWLSAAFALVGGVQLWVLRVLEVTIFVAELLLALSIVRWCRVSAPTVVLTGAAVFAVGAPASEWISVYSSVAVLFGMVALRMLLAWLDRADASAPSPRSWVLAGVGGACGLSFASKPNIGLLVLAAASRVDLDHNARRGRQKPGTHWVARWLRSVARSSRCSWSWRSRSSPPDHGRRS